MAPKALVPVGASLRAPNRRQSNLLCRHLQLLHGFQSQIRQPFTVVRRHVRQDLAAHAWVPEAGDVRRDAAHRFRVIGLCLEEAGDVVRHVDEALNLHRVSVYSIRRCAHEYTECRPGRANPTSVTLAACAISTASAVGAETAANMGAPNIAAL